MGKIKQLSPHEAQKIAAGQVVDRPANVIKELVENAIDAGASHITIFIDDAGKTLLRIVDNGCGMDRDDAQLCFEKHATSKITHVDQLPSITTFGFRGEALASIAAVSRVTLLTKQADMLEGIKIQAQEGTLEISPVACPAGSDISVQSLFYNMPARAKFLKAPETELRHCLQTIHALCFAHIEIHFKIVVDGKTVLNCPAQETLIGRCAQIWDHAHMQHLIPIHATHKNYALTISGVISNHEWFRYDRSALFFLVNNRWITNQGLGRALTKGFANIIPQGRHPFACITISIDPTQLDINMHPRKEEIKFAHPRTVEMLIEQTVRAALEDHISGRVKRPITISQPAAEYVPATSFNYFNDVVPLSIPPVFHTEPAIQQTMHTAFNVPAFADLSDDSGEVVTKPERTFILIGQYHNTYLLIEQDDGLFLIDQHAAHERILYEQFADRFTKVAPVTLMFPQMMTCSPEDIALLTPHLSLFHENGIMIEPFGHDQLVIQATPVPLQHVSISELVKQVIGWMKENEHVDHEQFFKTMHYKLRAQMACKAAIKAGDSLTREQTIELLEKLHKTPNRFSCPHGRPTGWILSRDEIEKKFKRKT